MSLPVIALCMNDAVQINLPCHAFVHPKRNKEHGETLTNLSYARHI